MSAPMPDASRPGTSSTLSIPPPIPETSISKKAPTIGEPSRVEMAAKLPEAPMTSAAIGGASRLTRWTQSTPSPPPIRTSGASGPRTIPRLRVISDAATMPNSSIGGGLPAFLKPSAGEWPPWPGRNSIEQATSRPASAVIGTGHQFGGLEKPSSWGSVVKT